MITQNQEQWPEHAVCARCGAALGQDYRESPLGLRFCSDCFDGAIQERVRERAAEIFLRGRCSNCGGSLINGYRLNRLGVIYCLSCYGNQAEAREDVDPCTQVSRHGHPRHELAWRRTDLLAGGMFWISFAISHLFLFIDILFSSPSKSFLPHSGTFFKGLICLDLLTLVMLLASKRLPASKLATIWTLLIATGFIILVGREAFGLMR
jgi:hypothetical protein